MQALPESSPPRRQQRAVTEADLLTLSQSQERPWCFPSQGSERAVSGLGHLNVGLGCLANTHIHSVTKNGKALGKG